MIKPIMQSPIIRKTAIAMMLAGAALGVNAGNSRSNSTSTDPIASEQVVSKAGASALAATATANTPSLEHNKKLDKKIQAFATNAEEAANDKKQLDWLYQNLGTYAGSWAAQTTINEIVFKKTLEKFDKTESERLMAIAARPGVKQSREALTIWEDGLTDEQSKARSSLHLLGKFVEMQEGKFQSPFYILSEHAKFVNEALSQGIPSYEKCSEAVDKYANYVVDEGYLSKEQKQKYSADVDNYIKSMPVAKRNSVQGKADIISYKVYLLEYMILEQDYSREQKFMETKEWAPKFLKYIQGEYSRQTNPKNY